MTESRRDVSAIRSISISGATVAFYSVEGVTAKEVGEQMDLRGPVDESNYPSHAATHWQIRWSWPGHGTSTGDISLASVSMRAMTVLPKWEPPPKASLEDIEKWNRYLQDLAEHEAHHVKLAEEGRAAIEAAIRSATPETADDIAYAYLNECRRRNMVFDQESGHGGAHGLKFP